MPDLVEPIIVPAVETALTFAPWLVDVPVLGRILLLLAPGGGNDFKAIEELQRLANKRKTERATRIAKQARYVLKASDAMQCVEENLMNGSFLLSIGKALLNTVAGGLGPTSALELLTNRVFECIEEHTLKQTNRRRKKKETYYARPARGHGHGRGVTGKAR